jgi:hypothetical protein
LSNKTQEDVKRLLARSGKLNELWGEGCAEDGTPPRLLSRSGKLNAPQGEKEKAQSKRERHFLKIAFILRR